MKNTHEQIIIKRISDIITKMGNIINDNKKNTENIINHITSLKKQINRQFEQLNINNNININQQEINYNNGRYIGQILNGLPEGKGIIYYGNGNRYEGEWKNGKYEGKGIASWNDGDRYEGDFRNGKTEGKGIYYYHNGDRSMGDYHNDKQIGKHVKLTKEGKVKTYNY